MWINSTTVHRWTLFNFWREAPSRTSVYWWYDEFNQDRSSLQDEFREGHPKSVAVPETVDAVRQLILQDCHVTYHGIETRLDISGASIHSTLHDHLSKKFCSRWIPHNFPIPQKKVIGWKNASKLLLRCFERRLWYRDRLWILDLRVWARK